MLTLEKVARGLGKYKSMAMYFAKNEMLADDVLQDVFVKINRRKDKDGNLDFLQYKDGMNESYIFLMVKSCYYDIIRKETRYADAIPKAGLEQPKEPSIMEHHLKGLNWYDRKLTEVYFKEEHTIRSLAAATHISPTNVFLTLKKTKAHIKHNIEMEIKDEITAYVKQKAKGKKNPIPKVKSKSNTKSRGLGDSIEKVTKATGIKKIVDAFTPEGKDCGCEKRKELLNKIFPYTHTKCMTEGQYNDWNYTLSKIQDNRIDDAELKTIARLHSELFNHKYYEPCRCEPKSWKKLIVDINKVYKTYTDELQDS